MVFCAKILDGLFFAGHMHQSQHAREIPDEQQQERHNQHPFETNPCGQRGDCQHAHENVMRGGLDEGDRACENRDEQDD
jgi:hypothetical protein